MFIWADYQQRREQKGGHCLSQLMPKSKTEDADKGATLIAQCIATRLHVALHVARRPAGLDNVDMFHAH